MIIIVLLVIYSFWKEEVCNKGTRMLPFSSFFFLVLCDTYSVHCMNSTCTKIGGWLCVGSRGRKVMLSRKITAKEHLSQSSAPSGNRTQGHSMATSDFTTKPMVLPFCCYYCPHILIYTRTVSLASLPGPTNQCTWSATPVSASHNQHQY